MTINKFDQPIFDPQIADVLSLMKRETMLEINCVQVGKIKSYDSSNNTAKVTINVIRNLKNGNSLEYPELEDCPVFMLYGGTASITMPIQAGDDCLILFNDRCMDDWVLSGDVVAPTDRRIHSLSDGIVLVGVKSMADVSAVPSCLAINGGTNKISILNKDEDLKTLLLSVTALTTDIIALMKKIKCGTYSMVVPDPNSGFVTLETKITNANDAIAKLLL